MIDWLTDHPIWTGAIFAAILAALVVPIIVFAGGDDHPGQHCVDQETRLQPVLIGKTTTLMPETYCAKWAKDVTP